MQRILIITGAVLAGTALALGAPRHAHADRYEVTLAIRPTRGTARIWEAGTDERVEVRSRGLAASASLGVHDWLDLGGELVAGYFDEASYQMATLRRCSTPQPRKGIGG